MTPNTAHLKLEMRANTQHDTSSDLVEEAPPKLASPHRGERSDVAPKGLTTTPLISPAELRMKLRLSDGVRRSVEHARARLRAKVERGDGPPIVIVGPCSIHCETAALEYAERLSHLQKRLEGKLGLVMRVYFEKPRTTVGWKGFLYDPDVDGSDDLAQGLVRARALLLNIAGLGLPIASEILEPLAAEYMADCLSWVAVGARTSESQIHRQLASALPCPVGFKNGTDGSVEIAVQAMQSAASRHTHLGIDDHGRVAVKQSAGNPATHVVLRGGARGPNYDERSVEAVVNDLRARGHNHRVLVDCSHGNSEKDHNRQPHVARCVMRQVASGQSGILGIMLESHLEAGKQPEREPRRYGVSITDACIDFATTEALLVELARV